MKKWISDLVKSLTVVGLLSMPVGVALYDSGDEAIYTQTTTILGQERAEVGELVRLEVSGEDVEWTVLPEVADFQVFGENSQRMVISFRTPGVYTVIAAVITPEITVNVETRRIEVYTNTPAPTPTIAPTPKPEPEVSIVIKNYDNDSSRAVTLWAEMDSLPPRLAKDIATQLDLVAAEIDNGEIVTPEGVIARTSNLLGTMNLTPYAPFLQKLQQLMTDEADAGNLSTQEAHSLLWKSVAYGLKSYAAQPKGLNFSKAVMMRSN